MNPLHFDRRSIITVLLSLGCQGSSADSDDHSARSTSQAVDQAHERLWTQFIDQHGIVNDFVGDRPTPADCRLGKPNAIGWWSPIENGPMFTGLYLTAMCKRALRSGEPADKKKAHRMAYGLIKCTSVSDVPGFVARGVGTDGVCHYPLSSDDQLHPWFLGLHTYLASGLPDNQERLTLLGKYQEVASALQANDWKVPCDGAFEGQHRGGFTGHLFRDAIRYLYLLRSAYAVTGDDAWLARYHQSLHESPPGGKHSRLKICAAGYPQDRATISHLDDHQLWIYVGCQASLAWLVRLETDPSVRVQFREGLIRNAQEAFPQIKAYAEFDNDDTKTFGNADWRNVYSEWFPQPTQQEAERLASKANVEKRGERKAYEVRWMRNPLAAAAIVALAGEARQNNELEQAIRHYDYSRLNMAEFFLAEFAYEWMLSSQTD